MQDFYTPVAPYTKLHQAEVAIKNAQTVEDLRQVMVQWAPQIGYKAFSYIFMAKATPEAMKPDEAIGVAAILESQGDLDGALEIYRRVLVVHMNHPVALAKVNSSAERLVDEIFRSVEKMPGANRT